MYFTTCYQYTGLVSEKLLSSFDINGIFPSNNIRNINPISVFFWGEEGGGGGFLFSLSMTLLGFKEV